MGYHSAGPLACFPPLLFFPSHRRSPLLQCPVFLLPTLPATPLTRFPPCLLPSLPASPSPAFSLACFPPRLAPRQLGPPRTGPLPRLLPPSSGPPGLVRQHLLIPPPPPPPVPPPLVCFAARLPLLACSCPSCIPFTRFELGEPCLMCLQCSLLRKTAGEGEGRQGWSTKRGDRQRRSQARGGRQGGSRQGHGHGSHMLGDWAMHCFLAANLAAPWRYIQSVAPRCICFTQWRSEQVPECRGRSGLT